MMKRMNKAQEGNNDNNSSFELSDLNLSPQKVAIIIALLTDVLEPGLIAVDKEQEVIIELHGSLKKKTKADQMVEEMRGMSFGEILDALTK